MLKDKASCFFLVHKVVPSIEDASIQIRKVISTEKEKCTGYLLRSIRVNTYVQCVTLASVSVSITPLGTTSSSPA